MLVGSFSTNLYGIPRATQDADFVVQLGTESISELAARFGPRFRFDRQASFETVTGTTRYILEAIDSPFKIELFLLSTDEHDQQRFASRRRVRLLGRETFVPTAEDVIVTKLRWSRRGQRTKDVDDIRNVIALRGDRIDWNYVRQWCERHDTLALLDEVRGSVPPL